MSAVSRDNFECSAHAASEFVALLVIVVVVVAIVESGPTHSAHYWQMTSRIAAVFSLSSLWLSLYLCLTHCLLQWLFLYRNQVNSWNSFKPAREIEIVQIDVNVDASSGTNRLLILTVIIINNICILDIPYLYLIIIAFAYCSEVILRSTFYIYIYWLISKLYVLIGECDVCTDNKHV